MWEDFRHVLKEKRLFAKTLYSPNSLLSLSSLAFLSFSTHLLCLLYFEFKTFSTVLPSLTVTRASHSPADGCRVSVPWEAPVQSWTCRRDVGRGLSGAGETPDGSAPAHRRFVLDSSCLHLPLLGRCHSQLPLKPISTPLPLKCCFVHRAWISRWLQCIVSFSPHFLLTHQMGCLAICLLQVRKYEIVTADGKMGKSDHDSNKEKQGSNRSNEEQAVSEKKRPRDIKGISEKRKAGKKRGKQQICKTEKRKIDYEFANCPR